MATPSAFEQSLKLAKAFARLSGQAATESNRIRREIADANIDAETFQADRALRETRSRLSEAFSDHIGTLAVNAAYRGSSIGDASPQAAVLSATFRASNEVAVAEANRAAKVASVTARNLFVEENVTLASIEGGLRGFNVGLGIASALDAMTEVQQRRRVEILNVGGGGFGFANVIEDIAFTPGLNLSNLDFGLNF